MRLSGRMERLGTESAFEVLARARALEAQGRAVTHLEIGEPDLPTPAHIVEAAVLALEQGHTHYVPSPGIPELREAVAEFLERTGRMTTSPDRVVVTPGAKPILWYLLHAVCEEGDEVLVPDPGFPIYASLASFVGATPVPVPLREEHGFRMDPAELASLVSERTKLLIVSSPENPCGSALTREDVEAIATVAIEHDLLVLSDEIYWAIRYDGREHASVLDIDGMAERTVLLDGWSKTFAMTGWRLGFGVLPGWLVEPITRLVINSVSCTSAFGQHAAIAALRGPWDPVEAMVAEFARRRDVVVDGLSAIEGMACARPDGAFYVFPSVRALGVPSREVERHLLEDAGVAVLSGSGFGTHGEGFLRLSYATAIERIRVALDAIGVSVARLGR
jgi:aspartate/methionine/tyrosine aminotransferase